jgi:hypothetical protein
MQGHLAQTRLLPSWWVPLPLYLKKKNPTTMRNAILSHRTIQKKKKKPEAKKTGLTDNVNNTMFLAIGLGKL